ncbi:MAG: Asp-tRNA(Asn)/Glu-tRNA(Gln) amidotransferase subunit GatC, partial [Desulfitobacteriia bacterium]
VDLVRLRLSEEEIDLFTRELSSILEYTARLKEVQTQDVKPMIWGLELLNVWREDKSEPSLARDKALENAPEARDGFIIVPKIV